MLPLYEWTTPTAEAAVITELAQTLAIPTAAARLLATRGWCDPVAAERFLNPRLTDLGDPLAFPGMTAATVRLWQAIDRGESIVVFGDFDADGVTATALLTAALEAFGGQAQPFIPNRLTEGYGLSLAALARFGVEHPDAQLIVTVDCGITAADALRVFRDEGREVIVTDHHVPDAAQSLANACVVINPHLPGTPAGCESLCGAGVAFKLACALWKTGKEAGRAAAITWDPRTWFDAVAVATVADVVPLLGENRVLVHAGLKRLHVQPSPGLKALLHKSLGTAEPLTSHHLAFLLGPRLNAAGRMCDALLALELLRTRDADEAHALAIRLDQLNAERRQIEETILAEALAQLAATAPTAAAAGAVVAGGIDWHPGTVGIVAARLNELTGVPAAVVSLRPDGGGRGSLRANKGYDALAALQCCDAWLDGFGGHRLAAGFEIKPGAFSAFRSAFAAACAAQHPAGAVRAELEIDGWLKPEEVTASLWQTLLRMEPFGEGNRRPRWAMRDVTLAARPRAVGSNGAHVIFQFVCGDHTFRGIWFRSSHLLETIIAHAGGRFDVVFECRLNRYKGAETIEMHVVDLRLNAADKTDAPLQ